jgi:hypothetical protein
MRFFGNNSTIFTSLIWDSIKTIPLNLFFLKNLTPDSIKTVKMIKTFYFLKAWLQQN